MPYNLLSVSDAVRDQRSIVFTSKGAYLFPYRLFELLYLLHKVAENKRGLYIVKAKEYPHTNTVDLAYSATKISAPTPIALQNRTQVPHMPTKSQKYTPRYTLLPPRVQLRNQTITPTVLSSRSTPSLYSPHDNQPTHGLAKNTISTWIHNWLLALNYAHNDAIRGTLKIHKHLNAGALSNEFITCTAFHRGKIARAPHKLTTTASGTVLFTNLDDPITTIGDLGERYFVTFTDVGSRFTYPVHLQSKSQVLDAILMAIPYTKTKFGRPPTLIHSDNAKSFVSAAVQEATKLACTARSTTMPHNPE